jgi:type I restriction enzyme S subunit
MKDAGVTWLGQLPEHWTVKRGKNVFRCIDVRSEFGDEELLTVSSERGVVPRRTASVTMFKAESYAGYKLCWPGDLVINSLWAWARGLGVSRYHGIVSSAYGVYRVRPEANVLPQFIHELVRSSPFNWELRVRSKGIWTSRLQLTDESFLDAPFPLPSISEQSAIERFLDHVDRRIRRYIRAKQKLIKLLEEQKQAIIHRAVTRGLDPDVRLKPSGVEWLGDVPEHWQVLRGKYLGQLFSTPSVPDSDLAVGSEGQPMYLKVSDLTNSGPGLRVWSSALRVTNRSLVPVNASRRCLVFPKRGGAIYTNKVGLVDGTFFLDPNLMGWRIASRFDPRYVALLLKARTLVDLADVSSVPQLNNKHIYPICFPAPSRLEQESIVDWLATALAGVDAAESSVRVGIQLVREYRTRLIADVVTGKLDVREVAARLPNEVEEQEPLEEIEVGTDIDADMPNDIDSISEGAEA